MKKTIYVLLILLSFGMLVACETTNDPVIDNQPTSVEFEIKNNNLEPGIHTLKAKVFPENANQDVDFFLIGTYSEITLNANELKITDEAEHDIEFSVKVSSKENPLISNQTTFKVNNPLPDKIIIKTEEELRNINLKGSYVLGNDIVLTEIWTPLGLADNEDEGVIGNGFQGVLDGAGYTISNINTIDGGYNKGFFNQIDSDGVVKNIGFESGKEEGEGIQGAAWNGVVAGKNKGTIINVFTDVQVTQTGEPGAAFVGTNEGTIINSYAIGEVKTSTSTHGSGFINSASTGTIINSYVLDTSVIAAIGYNKTQDENIRKPLSWLQTASNFKKAEWDEDVWYLADGHLPILKNANFEPPALDVFVVINNTETQLDYRNESERTLQIEYTVSNTTNKEVLIELVNDVDGVWLSETGLLTITEEVLNNTVIKIRVRSLEDETKFNEITITILNDDKNEVIVINTLEEFFNLATTNNPAHLSLNYELGNDIDLGSEYWDNPIGSILDVPFTGTFDGKGFSLLNWANSEYQNNYGLFYQIGEGGVVRNFSLHTRASRLKVRSSSAVIASENKGLIENILIEGEIISSGAYGAGIVYYNRESGVIRNSISLMKIYINDSSSNIGEVRAIVSTHHGKVENVFVDGELTGLKHISSSTSATPELDALLIKTTSQMKMSSTYNEFDQEVWFIKDGVYPMLRHDNFIEPDPEVMITITNGVLDLNYQVEEERSYQFEHLVLNAANDDVVYSLNETFTGVTITQSGLLTITEDVIDETSIIIRVSLVEDNSKFAELTLMIYNQIKGLIRYITTPEDLVALKNDTNPAVLNQHIELTNNIDMSGIDWDRPIGGEGNRDDDLSAFNGVFDGKGFAIINLTSTSNKAAYGLFTNIGEEGIIRNLSVHLESFKGGKRLGVLTWRNLGLIENVHLSGTLVGSDEYAAGIVYENEGLINGVVNLVTTIVAGEVLTIRAITNTNNGTISNVFVDGELTKKTVTIGRSSSEYDIFIYTTQEMKNAATYENLNNEVWEITEGEYPKLRQQ